MSSENDFKGVTNFGDSTISDILKTNLYYYLTWGFVQIGAYENVRVPTSGAYGGHDHRFRPVTDNRYQTGQVWEAFRKDWVWESGVNQSDQPIHISGVYVNNQYTPIQYADYVHGRVVLNSGISRTSVVHAEYSYRTVHVYDANDVPGFKQVQYESFRSDRNSFLITGSGAWDQSSETRIQLPAIIYEIVDGDYRGYQLGLGQYAFNDVIFHVLAEDGYMVDKISDILSYQVDKTFYLFDLDYLARSGVFPLDYRGSINNGAKTYPQLIEPKEDGGYRWRKATFNGVNKQRTNRINQSLYHRPIRIESEVVLTNI